MMKPFRVVCVDDSALFRTLIRNVLAEIPGCQLQESIGDSTIAADRIEALGPDLVTLDVEMPQVDGIQLLRELRRRRLSVPVIMLSRFTSAGAAATTDALLEGAFDFILKPQGANPRETKDVLKAELLARINVLREAAHEQAASGPTSTPPRLSSSSRAFGLALIGCSTGGPDALARVIPFLPATFPLPVVIVQHMPANFTTSLAHRLHEASEIEVLEAEDGLPIKPGRVILARGGRHLAFRRQGRELVSMITDDPHEHSCRPAIDYTCRSVIDALESPLLLTILTGMGRDGTDAARLTREHAGYVLTQDAESCAVYGMPKSVVRAGHSDEIITLDRIANKLSELTASRR